MENTNFEIIEENVQPVLAIRTRTPLANLPQVIGQSYGAIMQYMAEIGEQPANAPYIAYYNMDMEDLDVEMGFPVGKKIPGKEQIQPGEIPGGKKAACLYKGPYSEMESTYGQLMKWVEEQGHKLTGVFYEYYLNSPQEVPESELLTRIVLPLK